MADAHSSLLEWTASHGATLHPSLEISRDERSGAGFRVKDGSISPGDAVVTCPTPLTLSYLNALPTPPAPFHKDSASPVFPEAFLSSAPPHVVGRFFLVQQFLRGDESHWFLYIRSLPQPGDTESWLIPPFWEEDDLELLQGTNLEVSVGEINATLEREFSAAKKLLGGWEHAEGYSRHLYNWAYAIFTSRSFMPSLVVPNRHELKLPDGVAWDDFSVLMPLFDVGNHSMTAKTTWETEAGTGCRLVTGDTYAAGEQVFNNYGMKTNAQLLLAYGFVAPVTDGLHNDYVHIRKRAAPGEEGKKQPEYLFSLRPMADESSVIGRAMREEPLTAEETFPAFRHVQDGMILDLVQQIVNHNPALEPPADGSKSLLKRVLTADLPRESAQLLNIVIATVQNKALQELEKLNQSEVEVDEGQVADLTRCQALAVGYRRRCREVLEAVLEGIEASVDDARFVAIMGGGES